MFSRGVAARSLRQCQCLRNVSLYNARVMRKRTITSSASSVPVPVSSAAKAHPWAGVTSQIDDIAPRFEIDASQIEIINSPTAFYATLKVPRYCLKSWTTR